MEQLHFYEDPNEGIVKRLIRFQKFLIDNELPTSFTLHTEDGFEEPDSDNRGYLLHLGEKVKDKLL